MLIDEFDAKTDDDRLAACHRIVLSGHAEDDPNVPEVIQESINGRPTATIKVGGIPRLYTLYHAGATGTGTLLLRVSPGVQAYDFTFG